MAFGIGSLVFVFFALVGLTFMTAGIIFVIKNIKWKKQKEEQGLSVTSNIVAIVLFSFLIFFGAVWLLCFGAAAVVFNVIAF